MSNDPSKDKSDEQLQNFTRAVKTIVNVPKDAVSKKPDKSGSVWKIVKPGSCPVCGQPFSPRDHHHDGKSSRQQ